MTAMKLNTGEWVHLPGAPFVVDSTGVISAPELDELKVLAENLDQSTILLTARALLRGAHRRRHQDRYQDVNRARLQLALLCIERANSRPPSQH